MLSNCCGGSVYVRLDDQGTYFICSICGQRCGTITREDKVSLEKEIKGVDENDVVPSY